MTDKTTIETYVNKCYQLHSMTINSMTLQQTPGEFLRKYVPYSNKYERLRTTKIPSESPRKKGRFPVIYLDMLRVGAGDWQLRAPSLP